jgi:nucleoporin NDC1
MATIVPEITVEASKELPLKRICAERFLYAIFYCVFAQYFLFFLFLFFINFNVHPVVWIKQSITLLFSVSTWFWSTPLISAVILHGILLAKNCLSLKTFYSTQFSMLTHTAVKRTIFLSMYMLIGFLTAWLYSTYLPKTYASLFRTCNDTNNCLSEKHLFLTVGGLFAGAYYFFKIHVKDTGITFPVVQQSKFIRVRACLWGTVCKSMGNAVQPTIFYAIAYSVVRGPIRGRIQSLFRLEVDDETGYFDLVTDFRLLMYVWLLLTQVLVNMNLMRTLFEIFVTEHKEFLIAAGELRPLL